MAEPANTLEKQCHSFKEPDTIKLEPDFLVTPFCCVSAHFSCKDGFLVELK